MKFRKICLSTLVATAALAVMISVLASMLPSRAPAPRVIEIDTRYMLVVNGQSVECRRHEDRVTGTVTTAC